MRNFSRLCLWNNIHPSVNSLRAKITGTGERDCKPSSYKKKLEIKKAFLACHLGWQVSVYVNGKLDIIWHFYLLLDSSSVATEEVGKSGSQKARRPCNREIYWHQIRPVTKVTFDFQNKQCTTSAYKDCPIVGPKAMAHISIASA